MTMLAMVLSQGGKKIQSRNVNNKFMTQIFVSAFSTAPSSQIGISSRTKNAFVNPVASSSSWQSRMQFSTTEDDNTRTALKATVEDDLDSALDSILGEAFNEAGDDSATKRANIKVEVNDVEETNGKVEVRTCFVTFIYLSQSTFHLNHS